MSKKIGDNDKISGVIAGWDATFVTSFVAHLNGESGFNSTVGIMSGSGLIKMSIDQNIKAGETYDIDATGSDKKVRLEFDDTRQGESGNYMATSGKFTVLQLQGNILSASLHFEAQNAQDPQKKMSFTQGAYKVEDFKHV
ncbi:hypothetical protein CER19_20880 [Pseudomonas sp. GL93]|uniref:hypothetical protein n=1 Tax=unclassified Pseudomonas TaxID=196821 RepID=UPI000E30B68E|nr:MULTISPECIES: hypothetical protein [unclassified Pseudomonas]RFD26404.1 hypothetical protein CER19_20880 [Pseudomonas sp. GL93]